MLIFAVVQQRSFYYNYDKKGRVVAKKLPNKGWEYFYYDKLNRLRYAKDAIQGSKGLFTYTKYDQHGRTIQTGLTTDNSVSLYVDVSGAYFEIKQNEASTYQQVKYTNTSLPRAANTILTETFYDNYPYNIKATAKTGIETTVQARGLQTWQKIAVLSASQYGAVGNTPLIGASFYDSKGQLTHTFEDNYQGGRSTSWMKYSFEGLPTQTDYEVCTTAGFKSGTQTCRSWTETQSYYHNSSPKQLRHQMQGQAAIILASNSYDELNRLQTKRQSSGNSTIVQVGSSRSLSSRWDTRTTPFGTYYHDNRMQLIYTASELASIGADGIIESIGFEVGTANSQNQV
jgi:hypothetical protein